MVAVMRLAKGDQAKMRQVIALDGQAVDAPTLVARFVREMDHRPVKDRTIRADIPHNTQSQRRKFLAFILETHLSAGDTVAMFEMSQPAVSKHLAILEGAGLVWKKRDGMHVFYGMQTETLSGTLATFMQAVCPPSRSLKHEAQDKADP